MTSKKLTYYQEDRAELYGFAARAGLHIHGRALNVGCGAGLDARFLRQLGADEIHGIEPFEGAARLASLRYDHVFIGPVEAWREDAKPYSLVVFADVLEHLVDPQSVLVRARSWLSRDGHVLISIPNVRHVSVLWPLVVQGEWRYGEHGILDDSHLRFFTRQSFLRLLEQSHYQSVAVRYWGSNILTRAMGRVFPRSGELLLSQIFILARPRL
jgi:predicted TPR repeat methyltransferase